MFRLMLYAMDFRHLIASDHEDTVLDFDELAICHSNIRPYHAPKLCDLLTCCLLRAFFLSAVLFIYSYHIRYRKTAKKSILDLQLNLVAIYVNF